MTERLRGLVSEKLTFVGVQLQDLWQETWTMNHSFKRALSSQPSPYTSNLTTTEEDDNSSHQIPQPDCHTQEPESQGLADGDANEVDSNTSTYVNAFTQTDMPSSTSTPITEYEDIRSDCGSDTDHFGGEKIPCVDNRQDIRVHNMPSFKVSEIHSEDDAAPEVFDGPSRLVVAKHDDKKYLAILVTKEMIRRLKDLSTESKKLERSEPEFAEADQKVNVTRINVEYCENLLEDAKSQEEVDDIREDLAWRQSTLPKDEKRRDDLEERVVRLRRNVAYMEGFFTEMCQNILGNAGLLELDNGAIEEEGDENEDAENESGSPLEDDHYPVHRSDYSSVSIDELARRTANEEVRQRHAELLEIEHEFDTRQETYEKQNARFQQMVREGSCPMTQTEFDHADFEVTRGLTIDLREAEEKYEEALARRNKLGPNEEEQESDFVDDEYDGYPLSWENDGIVCAPKAMINKWLEDIPDVEDLASLAQLVEDDRHCVRQVGHELIEDCDIRSARMSDGWSCCDWTRNRRRIDRWRTIAGRDR
ncbi:MAG: hypothetical protein Q9213_004952 [Squamulea squamosa]